MVDQASRRGSLCEAGTRSRNYKPVITLVELQGRIVILVELTRKVSGLPSKVSINVDFLESIEDVRIGDINSRLTMKSGRHFDVIEAREEVVGLLKSAIYSVIG